MATSVPKEGNHAFMPTSNDMLFTNGNGDRHIPNQIDGFTRRQSSSATSTASTLHSASLPSQPQQVRSRSEPAQSMARPSWASSSPGQDNSASAMPVEVLAMGRTSEAAMKHWYEQFVHARDAHQRDQKVWFEEKDLLRRYIQYLQAELTKATSRRLSSTTSSRSGSRSKENDKVYNDPGLVRAANEKLKLFSVSSSQEGTPLGESNRSTQAPSAASNLHGSQPVVRLNSIPEYENGAQEPLEENNERRRQDSIDRGETGEIPISLDSEQSISPPTMMLPLSPPPPMNRLYAGHTPLMTPGTKRSLGASFPFSEAVVDDDNGSATEHDGEVEAPVDDQILDDLEDSGDVELNSPKILPSDPNRASADLEALSQLSQRLMDLTNENGGAGPDEEQSQGLHEDAVASEELEQTDKSDEANASGNAEEFGGVILKKSRSMNFGAEIGRLR